VKVSIRIYPEWEKDTAANGTQICWMIAAGRLYGPQQEKNTRDKRRLFEPKIAVVKTC
jgi:hypothetical protein